MFNFIPNSIEIASIKVCLSIDLIYPLDVILLLLAIHSSQKTLYLPLNNSFTHRAKRCKYLVELEGKMNTFVFLGENLSWIDPQLSKNKIELFFLL